MSAFRLRELACAVAAVLAGLHGGACATVIIHDDLTGASSKFPWKALNGACLTAGDNTGTIPACVGLPYYGSAVHVGGISGRLPDPPGAGALRLTNGDFSEKRSHTAGLSGINSVYQTGAVISKFTFPSHEGLRVNFTSVTYGGNNLDGHGADGIGFFLVDGSRPISIGATGGSLGYSCKNLLIAFDPTTGSFDAVPGNPRDIPTVYNGIDGGYIGLGIDEYGNFANPADNTSTGLGFAPGRISLRGAGDTRWARLNSDHPGLYPASLGIHKQAEAVRKTCTTGTLWDYGAATPVDTGRPWPLNYRHFASTDLPAGITIENQQGVDRPLRGRALPMRHSLELSQDGYLSFSYSLNGGLSQPVVVNRRISESNGPVPEWFRFGFSGSTGGGSNVHEITCFKAEPLSTASTSAGANVQPSARVHAGSQVYLAFNHPTNWWGQLKAHPLLEDTATGDLSIGAAAAWDAHCTLTGGACAALGGRDVSAQAPAARSILTWNATAGIPLQWASLTPAQRAALTSGEASATAERLEYLRGERSREVARGGGLRTRTGVLGDMLDASPTWVGAPASPYEGPWADKLTGASMEENRGESYAAFKARLANRQHLVYAGANDGLMHAFRAGGPGASNANDGTEALAYMPGAVLAAIHSTNPIFDFSNPRFAHNLYVDATPGVGDLHYRSGWHTWLVAGLGPARNDGGPVGDRVTAVGGAIYALDITDPAAFGEAGAASIVVGEWTSATIACLNVAGCGDNLGAVTGAPAIRRLHNGQWAALFGNGSNSVRGTAGLFIMLVDPASGRVSFRYLDTGVGASAGGARNGIANVTPVDLDGDHVTDHVYAGDAHGNLWRFDLTAADADRWSASPSPVFRTEGQPISGRVVVASVPGAGGLPRVVVAFGTGEKLPQSLTGAVQYASGVQSLYGVWDADFEGWNAKTPTGPRYASLPSPPTVRTSQLLTQSASSEAAAAGGLSYRTATQAPLCWSGSPACPGEAGRMGWTLALPGTREQVIHNAVLAYGMFIVNTTIPETRDDLSCNSSAPGGYTMALSMESGGSAKLPFFPDAGVPNVAGLRLDATGSPSVVTTRTKPFLVQQTVSGKGAVTRINPAPSGAGGRLNWIQVR